MGAHALLSPSAAHRWLNCTAAPLLEAAVPDNETPFALEGSLAHALCAKKLKAELLGQDTAGEDAEIAALAERAGEITEEMEDAANVYADITAEKLAEARTRSKDAFLLVERRLDFSKYVPGSFGTADAVLIADDLMEIIDFKYGKGVRVDAERNPQMMIYALGALAAFWAEYDIRRVRMTIIQPRMDNISEYEAGVLDLLRWAEETLKPKAAEAYAGGSQKPGGWCRFCKVKGRCRALKEFAERTEAECPDPRLLGADGLAELLPKLETVKIWTAAVEEAALASALGGVKIPGYKLVEGRSARRISDPGAAADALRAAGLPDEKFMSVPQLKTITELERAVGKKAFAEIAGAYVVKPAGKPTLVPESDKRKEWNGAAADFRDIEFSGQENEQ